MSTNVRDQRRGHRRHRSQAPSPDHIEDIFRNIQDDLTRTPDSEQAMTAERVNQITANAQHLQNPQQFVSGHEPVDRFVNGVLQARNQNRNDIRGHWTAMEHHEEENNITSVRLTWTNNGYVLFTYEASMRQFITLCAYPHFIMARRRNRRDRRIGFAYVYAMSVPFHMNERQGGREEDIAARDFMLVDDDLASEDVEMADW